MKAVLRGFIALTLVFSLHSFYGQQNTVTGTITSVEGLPLPGVNIVIKGTTQGTQTDFDGRYSIQVDEDYIIVFSYLGYLKVEELVGNRSSIDVTMIEDATQLEEVVVVALGIQREKKSLGYATQELQGEDVSSIKTQNFVNSLSGKVAGLDIRPSGTLGGSTNVVIRGNSSIEGNNQALFVIDGIPINNDTGNSQQQRQGFGGVDYGNAASDINPDEIETINVLKGAAATALYGSRAANGVIMITTKRGKQKDGVGISFNSTFTFTSVDKETLPVYQKSYGAGYGPFYDSADGYFGLFDVDGDGVDDLTTPFTEDASYGARFDPNLNVFQWNSLYQGLDTYLQATPWVAGVNDPNFIWEEGMTTINTVALDGKTDQSDFRLSITNLFQEGNLPNSEIKRNTISFSGSHQLTDKLKASTVFNFIKTDGLGRYGTGYDGNNEIISFRQWWQVNVDMAEQRDAYFKLRQNATWNPLGADNTRPIYANNAYWGWFENFTTDTRNRYFGNFVLNYQITDWLSALARFTFDTYDELREQRTEVGSVSIPGYTRQDRSLAEYNYDLILNANKSLSEKLNLVGTLGFNLRRNEWNNTSSRTSDGLLIPDLFTLSNSEGPIVSSQYDATKLVDGFYAQASFGYNSLAYLEGTYRTDRSSALPRTNNRYNYWSVTGSLIFSQILEQDWLTFGKLRANYGLVGNDTDPFRVLNTFDVITPPFNGGLASNPDSRNNENLRPEEQRNWEVGMELIFLDRRAGLDVSYYDNQNIDQITQVPISDATGFQSILLNAGTIENKGWEIQLYGSPIKLADFKWDLRVNWTRNRSQVIELAEGVDNLQLAFFQQASLNAVPGEPYGTIRGTNFVFNDNGQPIVDEFGFYLVSETNNEVIGDINPEWTAGILNGFTYKNISLSFLIDIKKGGDLFSLDTFYGYTTGIYDFSAAKNELGNPIRDPVTNGPDSGGILLPGVQADGSPNTVRGDMSTFINPVGFYAPEAYHVYDAGFVKLREASITYTLGQKILSKLPISSGSISFIGRNLWIIDKNVPYSDPEAGLSAGNLQGFQVGTYPAVREIGCNLKVQF